MYKQKDQQNKISKNLNLKNYLNNKNIGYFFNSQQNFLKQQMQCSAQVYLESFEERPSTYLLKTFSKKVALIICYLCLMIQPKFDGSIFQGKDTTNLRNIAKKHFGWRYQVQNNRSQVIQDGKNIIELLQINIDIITTHIQMITRVFADVSNQKLIEQIKKIKNQHFSLKVIMNICQQPSLKKRNNEQKQIIIFQVKDKTNQNNFQRIGIFKQNENSFILFAIFSKDQPKLKLINQEKIVNNVQKNIKKLPQNQNQIKKLPQNQKNIKNKVLIQEFKYICIVFIMIILALYTFDDEIKTSLQKRDPYL